MTKTRTTTCMCHARGCPGGRAGMAANGCGSIINDSKMITAQTYIIDGGLV